MNTLGAVIVAIGVLVASPAAPSPATGTQDHEAAWLLAFGAPGYGFPLGEPGSGGCWGDLIIAPSLEAGEGIWYARMDVDPGTWGADFTATFATATGLDVAYLMGAVGITFYDASGEVIGGASAGGYDRVLGGDRIARGRVPRSTTAASFWACEDIGPFTAVYRAGGAV